MFKENRFLFIALVFLILSSIIIIIVVSEKTKHIYIKEAVAYNEIREKYSATPVVSSSIELPIEEAAVSLIEDVTFPVEVDFDGLTEINDDIVAWLYIPGIEISYPVCITDNNDYYLSHSITGEYTKSGALFIDCINSSDFSDNNTIIYGHHLFDHTMFGDLEKYKKQEYYDEFPVAYLKTVDGGTYTLKIYSVYITDGTSSAYDTVFNGTYEYEKWLNDTIRNSIIDGLYIPEVDDRIVTFSTCDYEIMGKKTVIHSILE